MVVATSPDARARMCRAAIELFLENGYQATTTDQIASRAGVTQRTFFRHFRDKEEVLFGEDRDFLEVLVTAVRAQPGGTPPLRVVRAALLALARTFQPHREELRTRAAIIASDERLRARELLKIDRWRACLDGVMRERGVDDEPAALSVALGTACFEVAYRAWVSDRARTGLGTRVERALDGLEALVLGGRVDPPVTP